MATNALEPSNCSNDKPFNHHPDQHKQLSRETDERHLLRLAREMAEAFIFGDAHDPWFAKHIAPDFQGTHDLFERPMTMHEFLQLIHEIRLAHGDRRFKIVDERVDFGDVAPQRTEAFVWQSVQFVIYPETIVRSAMRTSRWRLDHQKQTWVCYEHATFKNDALASGNIAPGL